MEQKKPYSQQFLEQASKSAELALNPHRICEIYGEFRFFEGKWVYAYAIEKVAIEDGLRRLARQHGLINPDKK
jgi:hypothetical protein